MMESMRQREASGKKNMDYLEFLMGLKNRKEIDGEFRVNFTISFVILSKAKKLFFWD